MKNLKFVLSFFFQVYTANAQSNGRTILCIYSLLPNKASATQNQYFTELQNVYQTYINGCFSSKHITLLDKDLNFSPLQG